MLTKETVGLRALTTNPNVLNWQVFLYSFYQKSIQYSIALTGRSTHYQKQSLTEINKNFFIDFLVYLQLRQTFIIKAVYLYLNLKKNKRDKSRGISLKIKLYLRHFQDEVEIIQQHL